MCSASRYAFGLIDYLTHAARAAKQNRTDAHLFSAHTLERDLNQRVVSQFQIPSD